MPGTDPSTWSFKRQLNNELMRFQAEGAMGFVDVHLAGVNKLFGQLADQGVLMQDDLKKFTLETYSRIVMRTPVRTGRARAAWHIVEPNTAVDTYTYTVPRSQYGRGGTFDGSIPGSTGPWDTIIGNNVEYILSLEAGHSRQAPNGMVAITLAELSNALATTLERRLTQVGRNG